MRLCRIPQSFALAFLAIQGTTAQAIDSSNDVIQPQHQTPNTKSAAIDSEKFELGAFIGTLSIEDFSSNTVAGVSLNYHLNQKLLVQLNYGESEVGETTSEAVTGTNLLSSKDRRFRYYNFLAGYKLFPGRSFLGSKRKFNSDIYLLAGVNNIEFAGESKSGITLGASYRIVLSDWLTCNLDFRDHIVERNYLNQSKTTQNTEMTLGFNILF